MTITCGPEWRIESAALGSGTVQAKLPIVSFDAQNLVNDIGAGTFTMHPGDIKNLRHVWPDMTSIWCTLNGEFAWGGMITGLSLQNGTLSLGCVSIEGYLARRKIRRTLAYPDADQNQTAAALVEYARANYGIPLFGTWVPSMQRRDRTYLGTDRVGVMDSIQGIVTVEDGNEWRSTAERVGGRWLATMQFADAWGIDTGITLVSDVQAPDYGLEIGTDSHATVIDYVGQASGDAAPPIGTAENLPYPAGGSPYVQFDRTEAGSDSTTSVETLQQQAAGDLRVNGEPLVTPRMVLSGDAMQGLGIKLGDIVDARMCYSGIRYEGKSRVIGETWKAAPDAATTRELLLTPNGRPSQTLLDQPPCSDCIDCD